MAIVVYSSHTGSTKKYAEAFASKVGYKCFSVKDKYDPDEEIIYFGWLRGPKVVDLGTIDRRRLIAVATVSIENHSDFFRKVKDANNINVPAYHLRGWIDRKKVGIMGKLMFLFICVMYKLKGLDDYTGPMFNAMMEGGSFYDESALEPLIQFVSTRGH